MRICWVLWWVVSCSSALILPSSTHRNAGSHGPSDKTAAIAQTIAVAQQVQSGLGQHMAALTVASPRSGTCKSSSAGSRELIGSYFPATGSVRFSILLRHICLAFQDGRLALS